MTDRDGTRERLDSGDVSRVLRRALELEQQAARSDDTGVSPDALIEAAVEIGIDEDAVRDSLAIERLTVEPSPARRFDRLAGPSSVVVERELEVTLPAALASIESWLTAAHRLRCARHADGSLHARRRSDTAAAATRFIAGLRGEARLGRVHSLTAEAVPMTVGATNVAGHRTLVRIEADRESSRRHRLGSGVALGAAGVVSGAVVATGVLVALPAIAVPSAAVGYLVARSGAGDAERLELEIERLLSAVGRGEQPTGLFGKVASRARAAVRHRVSDTR